MRKIVCGFLIIAALLFCSAPIAAQDVTVYYNGTVLSTPEPAQSNDVTGDTVIPFRAIFEAMGFTIQYSGLDKPMIAVKDSTSIRLILDAKKAVVNGSKKLLKTPAYLLNGTTMVPLRFVAESAGAKVTWDGAAAAVYIQYPAENGGEVPLPDGEQSFSGTAADRLLSGDITMYLSDSISKFIGTVQGGGFSNGKYTTDSGTSYNGAWSSGLMNGNGRFWFANGSNNQNTYEGTFVNGAFVNGKVIFPDGSTYTGGWSNGVPQGQGTYTYPDNGPSISGNWNNGTISLSKATVK